jgi:hypothetical protein
MPPLMTIFTAPKPFTNPHIDLIQRNAIHSWVALGKDVRVLLIGDEEGMTEAAVDLGVRQLPDVSRNASGTPLVSSIFDLARQNSESPLLVYINADVLITSSMVDSARKVLEQTQKFLIVGQRWDLDVAEPLNFSDGWEALLIERTKREGRLHPPAGSDYFIFPRQCFTDIPKFAIGRAGWDNWMIYHARRQHWAVIDGTPSVFVVHQTHDYSHLPGGQVHYRLPETDENVRLAGGPRTIFRLEHANRVLKSGRINRLSWNWKRFWREVEIFPLVGLRSKALGQLFFAIFHPVKAYRELRQWMKQ